MATTASEHEVTLVLRLRSCGPQPIVTEPPYASAKLDGALASGTSAELEGMRDSLAKRASQILAEILATVAPQAEYPGVTLHSGLCLCLRTPTTCILTTLW